MLAAKHFDPVMGVDIHMVTIPPVGPIPIPHPHISMILDPADYIPLLGSTVLVGGVHKAGAGTAGMTVPHIPLGGPFVKPAGNEDEMFMGSATVLADGAPFSYTALPSLSCQDVGMPAPIRTKKPKKSYGMLLPLSVVITVPAGRPVMIGGPPTIDLIGLAMAGAFAALGALFKFLKKTKLGKKLGDKYKDVAGRLQDKLGDLMSKKGLSSKARNRIHNALCSVTGHPINVATGQLYTEAVDLELPGPIPFKLERIWRSTSRHDGDLGVGWHHSYDVKLYVENGVAVVQMADGRLAEFVEPDETLPSYNKQEKLFLKVKDGRYYLEDFQSNFKVFGEPVAEDDARYLLWEADAYGNRVSIQRNGKRVTGFIDSCGRHLRVETDYFGRMTEIHGPHPTRVGEEVRLMGYEYSDAADLICVRDAVEKPFQYHYINHLLVKETDREGYSFYFEFDSDWRESEDHTNAWCIKTWGDSNLFYRDIQYDREKGYTQSTDSKGGVTQYYWLESGLVYKEINPVGGVTQKEYDEHTHLLSETDALGQVTSYEYDDYGQLLLKTDPGGHTTQLEYDDQFNVVSVKNALKHQWRYQYNHQHDIVGVVHPNGLSEAITYNQRGEPTARRTGDKQQSLLWEHGLLRRLDLEGNSQYFLSYDRLGNVTQLITQTRDSAEKKKVYYQHDLLGQLTTRTNQLNEIEHYFYNGRGQLTHYTDALHRTTQYDYLYIALIHKTLPNQHSLHYQYDTELNLIELTNEKGDRYEFRYDKHERLIAERDFDGRRQLYEYDALDNVIQHRDGAERIIGYERNFRGQLLKKSASDEAVTDYNYDALGRLVSACNAHSELAFSYDAMGNCISEKQNDFRLTHSYDRYGDLAETKLPNGQVISYTQTKSSMGYQELEIALNKRALCQSTFDHLGQEVQRTFGGVAQINDYDIMGRLKKQSLTKQQQIKTVVAREYSYDKTGNITRIDDSHSGPSVYCYDAVERIASVSNYCPEKFVFDPAGNITSNAETGQSTYGAGIRLQFYEDKHFRYDDVGNLVEEAFGKNQCRVKRYTYNHENQLLQADVEGQTFHYQYDPLGRRIAKQDVFGVSQFIWQGDNLVGESRGHKTKWYIYEPESFRPLCFIEDDEAYYYNLDHAGTPQEMVNEAGELVWQVRYRAYGSVVRCEYEQVENNLRFQGQYYDAETGLHYNRFRYFHPGTGRYVSNDPIGLLGGDNLYAYGVNPVGWVDPLGLAGDYSIKGRLKSADLPTTGKIRYVPPKGYSPTNPLPRGPQNGYIDRFGNEWVKGPSRTGGQAFEWDVQLSNTGQSKIGWLTRDGSHANVSLDGRITHK